MASPKPSPGRVAHVLRKYDPAEWGGTETHVAAVTARLPDRGWLPEVHAPRGPASLDRALSPHVRLRRFRSFLPVLGRAERRSALISNAGNIVSLDEPFRLFLDRDIRLAHLHTMGRVGGAVRTAMRLSGRPYVISVHGPLLAQARWVADDNARRSAGTWDIGQPFGALFGVRRTLLQAARVITFNGEERDAIAERIGDRAVQMDHGVDIPRFSSGDAARAHERWPELGDAPVVLLVGRIASQKNQMLAVQAFARGAPSDHHLVLAGAATDYGYRDQVEREAMALGVGDRVHLLGNLDGATEIPDLYARACLVVVPSTHEAFGLIVLEGMAAGRPVLFARHSGLADIADALGHEPSTLASLEVEEWAAGVGRFLAEEPLRRAAVSASAALVRRRYDWDVVVGALAALYDEVVAERP